MSEGLDFYLHELIKQWGLDVPVRTNRAMFEGRRIRIEYPFADPSCTLCGTCKLDRVFELRVGGHRVVYIGDGYSDRCGALAADRVFARRGLATYLDEQGVPYEPFDDLHQIAAALS